MKQSGSVRWRFANAEFDEGSHELRVDGCLVPLEPKPLEALLCLLRAEGELVTKQELFDTVWSGRVVTDGVLSQAMFRIREALGDSDRTMLRTVHGYGFRLDVPIEFEGRDDVGTRLQLEAGQSLPNLADWLLEERLQTRPSNELWRVRHKQDGRTCVVKLALDERAQRALKREVTLNKVLRAELSDDYPLVPLLHWQFDSNPAWIQMPWYEHGSLADWLEAQGGAGKLDMQRRLRIVAEAADALAQAHSLGVMHKDLKPGNLLVEPKDGQLRLLLCDFGSGTIKSRERLQQAGVTVMGFTRTIHAEASTSGTPAYMAPEVLKGGVFSEQSDVYALGILLYQLVVGNLNEPLAAGWEEDVEDAGLRQIIAEACAGKPGRRTVSMQQLANNIRAWKPQAQATDFRAASPKFKFAAGMALLLALASFAAWQIVGPEADEAAAAAQVMPENNQRVAILAFSLLGLDEQTQTVMGGMQDALIADLASLDAVRVVHGQNLAALGVADADATTIGQALNADQLIQGSVQQLGEQLQVNLQIVAARSGETIWGRTIQGARQDLFAMQARIAQSLADALGTQMSTTANQADVSNEAYEAYLQALALWQQGHGQDAELNVAIDRALDLAPDFIDTQLLALMKAARDYWFSNVTRSEAETRIQQHLSVLEQLNTPPFKLATARAVRRYYLDHDPRGGLEILAPFRRQLIRNVESAMFNVYMLRRIGRSDEAFEVLDQVIQQDPSNMVPLETKAELLAHLGRGAEAMAVFQQTRQRFGASTALDVKMASFAYKLTGDVSILHESKKLLAGDQHFSKMQHLVDMEIARRAGDFSSMRKLARKFDGKDETISGHGRVPKELGSAFALLMAGAEESEVQGKAGIALERIQAWRAESDSHARRSTMALILALLGRSKEAIELVAQVEAAYPLERDYLVASDRMLEAALVHALAGDQSAVMKRLSQLAETPFIGVSLCSVPQSMEQQAIWDMETARDFIGSVCSDLWSSNRQDIRFAG